MVGRDRTSETSQRLPESPRWAFGLLLPYSLLSYLVRASGSPRTYLILFQEPWF